MIDDHRHRIIEAAARVYAQHGWRGATTRRIADEAGVNEVTLFRQFGSKHALLDQMMQLCARRDSSPSMPRTPKDPENDLLQWVVNQHEKISTMRSIVRQMMSDAEERPDVAGCASHGPSAAAAQLREYVVQLRRHGWIPESGDVTPAEVRAAVTMLMGALFADAMNRDLMPAMFSLPVQESLRGYVRIFLRGIGVRSEPETSTARTVERRSTFTSVSE
ncbi:MAG TPA: TetR/AcrR family transcriptional regulator [Gemmatimonas aurantiaca]|uniref:TetR family transcriptional regulator n=2 Tax=Gemmatimonas aurantiaca TaxID=173480 RepID=C1ACA8_GEMAT|nr:TetR/AcrR family transcriptional regulator [Gemmatimonas aurantiaca]BAH40135.1 TetR family transcriptional regulator [Gemmatimonas aurantiaca T-27]HCT57857.1 TetR/AcrR family transcriptional regulator [Gemmatimonas aurantiaca]